MCHLLNLLRSYATDMLFVLHHIQLTKSLACHFRTIARIEVRPRLRRARANDEMRRLFETAINASRRCPST